MANAEIKSVDFLGNFGSLKSFMLMSPTFDFLNSATINKSIDNSIFQNVQACLNKEMKVDGWVSFIIDKNTCITLKFNNGIFVNQGYVLSRDKILVVFENSETCNISNKVDSIESGIVDLDHGSRFEGLILIEKEKENEGKIQIPFGYGEMYDDDGILVYKGIMINWKRFGYGTSYHNNGAIEYEGYWCDDNRFGIGKVYDRKERIMKECNWYYGIECVFYEGNGSKPLNVGMKQLKLTENCVLTDWDVSWFLDLESIEIGNNNFGSVQTFKIDGLSKLKTLKIGRNSFTQVVEPIWNNNWDEAYDKAYNLSKSFHIVNCLSLESIQIGDYSFSDFAGEFELKNLPQLQSIQIGTIGSKSRNFYDGTLVLRGIDMVLSI